MKYERCGKNKRLIGFGVATAMVMVSAMLAQAAPGVYPLSEEEKADIGATHMVVVKYSDFTETSTNTAQTFTNSLPVKAKQGVEMVCMKLKTAFDTANTNYTGSCAVIVGDGNDDDCYLASTELASDGTEVWLKLGRQRADTSAILSAASPTLLTITNLIYAGGATTGNVTVATGISATTNSMSTIGAVLYTTNDYVDFKFTPNESEALSSNTVGEVHFYFRIFDAN